MVLFGGGAQIIEDNSGLDARDTARRIDFEDLCHVLRKVHGDSGVAALSGKRCAPTPREQWSPVVAAQGNRGEYIFFVARNYDADRDLAVIGTVGSVDGAAARVKADLSAKMAAERGLKRGGVKLRGMSERWSNGLRHKAQNIFVDAGVPRKG